jgi:hypothetical protein
VLPRTFASAGQFAAVFPGLRAGRYDLWIKPDQPNALTAVVAGGEVVTIEWPTPPSHVA